MKKLLLFFTATLTFTISFADYVPPVRTMVIPRACQQFIIDGIDDENSWSAEQTTEAFNPSGSTGADADYTFTFKVAYDAYYLYVFGKILDDYDSSWEWGEPNQWNYDNVEVFVDLDTNSSGSKPDYDSNTYQLRINRGIDSIGNEYGRDCLRSDHKYYWENTADGWIFEASLSWKFVLGAGQKLEEILQYCDGIVVSGFDMSGTDSDTDGEGTHDCQTAWDMDDPNDAADRTEDNAWNNRTVFGAITFGYYGCHGSVKDHDNIAVIDLYPNPAGNLLVIDNITNISKLEICNMLGEILKTTDVITGKNEINIAGLPSGNLYFLRVKDSNGNISIGKFMKE